MDRTVTRDFELYSECTENHVRSTCLQVQALKNSGEDVDVTCTESELGSSHSSFEDMLNKMEHTVFCLIIPGDAQSTRRLSEIFMAGCIPVFLGPPYHTMPLAEDVNYRSIGIFFNISAYSSWLPEVSPSPVLPSIISSRSHNDLQQLNLKIHI